MKKILVFTALIAILNNGFADERKTLEKHVTVTSTQRVDIEGISGSDIELKSWDRNEVYMKIEVEISSSDDKYEKKYISSVQISESKRESAVRLRFEEMRTEEKGWSFLFKIFKRFYVSKKISGEVFVPRANPLTTDMKYGKISLEGMDGTVRLNGTTNTLKISDCSSLEEIQNNYGTTTIRNCGGKLQLDGTSSTIRVDGFNGSLHIDADYSEVALVRVTDKIRLNDKSGTIEIDEVNSDVRLDADYSTITVNNVKGFVDIKSTSATVRVKRVDGAQVQANYSEIDIAGVSGAAKKPIIITGQSGSLTLYDAAGNVEINNPYSNIDLRRIDGAIDLTSKSADVTAEDIKGDWKSQTEYSSIKVSRLAAQSIYITNKSNPVSLQLTAVPLRMDIKNEYGDVTVTMPHGFSGNVELDAEYGSVNTNLNVRRKSSGSSGFATGTIGSGSGSIFIHAKSSDIELIEE